MPGEGTMPAATRDAEEQERYVLGVTLYSADRFHEYTCPPPPPPVGTPVVIETERGVCLGWVRLRPRKASADEAASLPPIIRIATEADLLQEDRNREREAQAFRVCVQLIQKHQMKMKLVKVHYLLSGSKAVFYFTADGRVDFRALVRDLAAELRMRIEMRQIGVRDETKITGGVGHCGRELCCSGWLRNFVPVSIRMAKDQNLALNPQKVSGACGRLMCCLAYEHENYVALKRGLPKVGKRVNTVHGPGRVTSVEVLKQRLLVELDEGVRMQMTRDELIASRPPAPGPGGRSRPSRNRGNAASGNGASRNSERKSEDPGKNRPPKERTGRSGNQRDRRSRRGRQSRSGKD